MDEPTSIGDVIATLQAQFSDRCSVNRDILARHGRGESWHPSMAPDVVVFPASTDEVAAIMRLCAQSVVPVIPFGAGTSVEGQVQAVHGGVCIDLSQMKDIVAVHAEDLDCVIQPGVTRTQLNTHLRDTGLFFPIDPGAECTIGWNGGDPCVGDKCRALRHHAGKRTRINGCLGGWICHQDRRTGTQVSRRLRSNSSIYWLRRNVGYCH